jgi:general secretion pathway protein G
MGDWRTYPLAKQPLIWQPSALERLNRSGGFTLIELLLAVAIIGIMSSLAIPNYLGFLEKARVARAVAELNGLAKEVKGYTLSAELYPDSLTQIGRSTQLDPWGNPYQYLRINCGTVTLGRLDNLEPPAFGSIGPVLPVSVTFPAVNPHVSLAVDVGDHQGRMYLVAQGGNGGGGACGSGQPRKDHFLHPINSDFDLHSMGKDGDSVAPLTAQKSHDDVIRANDGSYYGLASKF